MLTLKLPDGSSRQVPPGTRSGKIEGDIVLKTDNPKAEKVVVSVDIWILNGK